MSTAGFDFDGAWAATTINNDAISNAADLTTDAISNDGKMGTEVAVDIDFGAGTISGDVMVYILREINDAPDYETESDRPMGRPVPNPVASTTRRMVIDVPGYVGDFKVLVANDCGVSITAWVNTRQYVTTITE